MIENEGEQIVGQDIDQVNSEITEILKMEKRFTFESDMARQIAIKIELIQKYYRAVIFVAIRDKVDMEKDDIVAEAKHLQKQFLEMEIDDVNIVEDLFDDRHVSVITADWNRKNPSMVYEPGLAQTVFTEMSFNSRLRLMLAVSKIAQQLSELISAEVDLHRDLVHSYFDDRVLDSMIKDRSDIDERET